MLAAHFSSSSIDISSTPLLRTYSAVLEENPLFVGNRPIRCLGNHRCPRSAPDLPSTVASCFSSPNDCRTPPPHRLRLRYRPPTVTCCSSVSDSHRTPSLLRLQLLTRLWPPFVFVIIPDFHSSSSLHTSLRLLAAIANPYRCRYVSVTFHMFLNVLLQRRIFYRSPTVHLVLSCIC